LDDLCAIKKEDRFHSCCNALQCSINYSVSQENVAYCTPLRLTFFPYTEWFNKMHAQISTQGDLKAER